MPRKKQVTPKTTPASEPVVEVVKVDVRDDGALPKQGERIHKELPQHEVSFHEKLQIVGLRVRRFLKEQVNAEMVYDAIPTGATKTTVREERFHASRLYDDEAKWLGRLPWRPFRPGTGLYTVDPRKVESRRLLIDERQFQTLKNEGLVGE